MLLKVLIPLLRILARTTIKKYRPEIIAVTGSAGKTSTKEAIYAVLKHRYRVRKSYANFNNEVGVPLTILGDYKKSGGFLFWIPVVFVATLRILTPRLVSSFRYPEIIILEYGADRPGDIEYLVRIARPKVGVVTLIGETPVHVEFYPNVEAVAQEKERLVRSLATSGYAVLNGDDERVRKMREATRGEVLTYGSNEDATVQIRDYEVQMQNTGAYPVPEGIRFILVINNESLPITLPGVIGKAQAYAVAAAAAVGLTRGMKLLEIGKALAYYRPPQRRLSFIRGIKNTLLVDDGYNSSPAAAKHALETMASIKSKRTVCILGDMRELGSYTETAHKQIGALAAKTCTLLVTIGPSATIIADEALKRGMKKTMVQSFQTVDEAIEPVKKSIAEGDTVLIKASLSVGALKIVEALRA